MKQCYRYTYMVGLDVYCEIPIDRDKAKKGTKIKVKTVYGKTVQLQIPANTKSDKTYRLKGMGIKSKDGEGDQFVKIKV